MKSLILALSIAAAAFLSPFGIAAESNGRGMASAAALDPKDVVEMPTDIDWKSPGSKPEFSKILKVVSVMDGSTSYYVLDRDFTQAMNGIQTDVRTMWSSDSVEGYITTRVGCGWATCAYGSVVAQRKFPSPIIISVGGEEFKVYGDSEGNFPLSSQLRKALVNGANTIVIKPDDVGRTISMGESTVKALHTLYSFLDSTKEEVPRYKLEARMLPKKTTIQKAIISYLDSVVQLEGRSQGTGFVIDAGGLILTNRHVVGRSKMLKIKYANGDSDEGNVIYRDDEIDFALVQPKLTHQLKPLPLCYLKYPVPADEVYALGNPHGLTSSVTKGIISAVRIAVKQQMNTAGTTIIQSDAPMTQGNSGGPLLNYNGEVLGVADYTLGSTTTFGGWISIIDILKKLDSKKPFVRPGQRLSECGNIVVDSVSSK